MKKLLFILGIVTLLSCNESYDSERRCYSCTKEQSKAAAEFVKNSIKSSNNMSDEEMEDVISELRKTSIILNCGQDNIKYNRNTRVIYDADTSKVYHLDIYL